MRSRIWSLVGVFFLLSLVSAFAQQTETAPPATFPAATHSEMNCSGFVTPTPVSKDLYVFDGADNDFHGKFRQWRPGEHVFVRSRGGSSFAVGNEYALVRPAKELMRVRWYDGQGGSLRSLGKPYEDVGRIKVVQVTEHGAIAEVTFACGPVMTGDRAITRAARMSPSYTPSASFERFAPPNNKQAGAITAGVGNAAYFGVGSMAYINLGTGDGAAPGQKYRVVHVIRERMGSAWTVGPEPPREITGELVTLHCEEKSCVAMVVTSTREIALRDGIELE